MAFRAFVHRFRSCAAARGRAAMGASAARGGNCALARVGAFGPETEAIMACAQRRAEAAALHLRLAHDRAFYNVYRVAYGQSAPPTPTPSEVMKYVAKMIMRAVKLNQLWENLEKLKEKLGGDAYALIQAAIASVLFLTFPYLETIDAWVPSAPETICPFLGIQGLPFEECPVQEAAVAVATLASSCTRYFVLLSGSLVLACSLDTCRVLLKVFKYFSNNSDTVDDDETGAITMEFIQVEEEMLLLNNKVAVTMNSETIMLLIKVIDLNNKQAQNCQAEYLKIINFDQDKLFELAVAASYLDIEGLRDLIHQMLVGVTKMQGNRDFTLEEEVENCGEDFE